MRILGTVASSSREVPGAPTIGTATNVGTGRAYNNGRADVTFTAPAVDGGLPILDYTVTSSPGGFTATGASSPLTVTGLQSSVSYTFTVTARTAIGTGPASAASNSITATTVPQAPTIGTATCATGQTYTGSASITVPFTAGATGGTAISGFNVTSSSANTGSGASSPISVSETVGNPTSTARTYTVTATNANGTSTASSASNSIAAVSKPQTPTIGTATRTGNTTVSQTYTANATGGSAITSVTATSSPSIGLSTSGTSSPVTITGTFVQGTSYTFTLTQTNAFGTSDASGSSNSVTPNPVPTLGAWTVSTAWPGGTISAPTGMGNTASLWVGTGYYIDEVPVSSALGYRWTGSAWSQRQYPTTLDGPGVARLNTTTTDNAIFVAGYNRSGYFIAQTYSYGDSGFVQRTSYPLDVAWVGAAALNQSVNVRVFGNAGNASSNSYYLTSLVGSWTSTGVANPNGSRYFGIDNNFGGEGWFWPNNNASASSYKVTSLTSAYSTITTPPWDYSENNIQNTVVNGVVLIFPNRIAYPRPYSFNGSTYTAQTTFPGTSGQVGGGAYTSTQYRLVNTNTASAEHYFATMS